MDVFEVVFLDENYISAMLVKIVIAIALFTCLRFFSGAVSNVSATRQLSEKDNPAFGISVAGVALAVAIMIGGTLYTQPEITLFEVFIATGLYGLLGIALMSLSRLIFDDFSLPKIKLSEQILKGNVAAGVMDAGNVISTSIVIYAVILWVEYNTLEGIKALLVGYLISQILLNVIGILRGKCFKRRNKKTSIENEIKRGNVALALRYSGYRIGTAFAIAAATNTLLYEMSAFIHLMLGWVGVSLVLLVLLTLLAKIADGVILWGIDAEDEVVRQRNVAIGAVQSAAYIGLGFLLFALV